MGDLLPPMVALVTSGVGTAYGGIGVVADLIVSALKRDTDVRVWKHPASLPWLLRAGIVGARTFFGGLERPDLVVYDHVHLAVLHSLIPGLRRVPYAVFLHGIEVWEPLVGRRREALVKANLLLANSTTTVTMARNVNPWLPEAEVVWLGVRGRPRANDLRSTPPVALFVGRMMPSERLKGHDAVLDAWPEIRSAVPEARLLIVGTGKDAGRLQRRVASERLVGVEYPGRVSDAERDRMYASCRLLFYPSKQEGFGLAAVEAASFGIPVLGLTGTVIEELFPNGAGATLAPSWARQDIARAAISVLHEAEFASALGLAAWKRVQTKFLQEQFAQRFRRALARFIPVYADTGSDMPALTTKTVSSQDRELTAWSKR
jgi:phosphatidylinositol alpha-1,6-mannosyltransferase